MKKFLLKVLLFFICVAVVDVLFGYGFSWLRSHAKGGSTANCEYIANRANEDIIILGSSRATHHYIPQIIEDSLKLSCYNCGEEGNGIVLAYGRMKMLTNRYKPKLIIYEITPGYDYGTNHDNKKFLGYLRPYYYKHEIRGIFDDFDDKWSPLKMKSYMYQNTMRLLPDLIDNIVFRDNKKGYEPLNGTLSNYKLPLSDKKIKVDSLRLSYVERFIVDLQEQNIPLLFVISPYFGSNSDIAKYEPAIALCEKYGVPFFNFINYPDIVEQSEYFQDLSHMNHKGAMAYTNMIVTKVLKDKDLYE